MCKCMKCGSNIKLESIIDKFLNRKTILKLKSSVEQEHIFKKLVQKDIKWCHGGKIDLSEKFEKYPIYIAINQNNNLFFRDMLDFTKEDIENDCILINYSITDNGIEIN